MVAKRLDAPYTPGRRNSARVKHKHRRRELFVVTGWRERAGLLPEFLLARRGADGSLRPAGSASLDLDADRRALLLSALSERELPSRRRRGAARWAVPEIELLAEVHGPVDGPVRDAVIHGVRMPTRRTSRATTPLLPGWRSRRGKRAAVPELLTAERCRGQFVLRPKRWLSSTNRSKSERVTRTRRPILTAGSCQWPIQSSGPSADSVSTRRPPRPPSGTTPQRAVAPVEPYRGLPDPGRPRKSFRTSVAHLIRQQRVGACNIGSCDLCVIWLISSPFMLYRTRAFRLLPVPFRLDKAEVAGSSPASSIAGFAGHSRSCHVLASESLRPESVPRSTQIVRKPGRSSPPHRIPSGDAGSSALRSRCPTDDRLPVSPLPSRCTWPGSEAL